MRVFSAAFAYALEQHDASSLSLRLGPVSLPATLRLLEHYAVRTRFSPVGTKVFSGTLFFRSGYR